MSAKDTLSRVVPSGWSTGQGGGWVGYEGKEKFVSLKWAALYSKVFPEAIFFGFGWVGVLGGVWHKASVFDCLPLAASVASRHCSF